jgi:hypothetical protein
MKHCFNQKVGHISLETVSHVSLHSGSAIGCGTLALTCARASGPLLAWPHEKSVLRSSRVQPNSALDIAHTAVQLSRRLEVSPPFVECNKTEGAGSANLPHQIMIYA